MPCHIFFTVMVFHHVGDNILHDETLRGETFIYLFPLFNCTF